MDSVDVCSSAKAGIESTFTLIWDSYNQDVPCQIQVSLIIWERLGLEKYSNAEEGT